MPATPQNPDRQQCRHIHADGRRCGSPCLRGEPFCYFHHTSRKPVSRPLERRSRRAAFDLPLPEDRTAIQLSIGEVARRLAANDVDPRRAGLLLYALQIASTNLSQARHDTAPTTQSPVEDLTLDPTLGPLAPPAPFTPTGTAAKRSLIETLLQTLRTPPAPEPEDASDTAPEPVPPPDADPASILPDLHAAAQPTPAPPTMASHPRKLAMRTPLLAAALVLSTLPLAAQQVVQRGALGAPAAVFDDTNQWTAPFLIAGAKDVEIYIPDISAQPWLKGNYDLFQSRGQYVITMFTRYRSAESCRKNQIAWGFGDQAHLDACATDIAYRVREATVDPNLKTVTLIMAAMVSPDGEIDPASVTRDPLTRRWAELDPNTQSALEKTTKLVTDAMARFDRRLQSTR